MDNRLANACVATKHRDMPGQGGFDERHNDAFGAGPGGSAGAMRIGLGIFGGIVMHNDFHAIHMDTPRSDIRRYENWLGAAGEGAQRPFALWLAETAMQSTGPDAGNYQFARETISRALGAHEQQRSLRAGRNRDSDIDLGFWCHTDEAMLHRGNVLVLSHNLVVNGIVLVTLHKAVDVTVERRREEQCLMLVFDAAKDALDLGHEPHIGHLVSLIEDHDANLVQIQRATVEQVVEAAGRGNDDVDASPEYVSLAVQRGATVDGGDANAASHGDRRKRPGDLAREFTGRDEHYGLGAAWPALRNELKEGKAESQCFTRACAGLAADIAAGQRIGNGEHLDRERFRDACRCQRVDDVRRYAKSGKRGPSRVIGRKRRKRGWDSLGFEFKQKNGLRSVVVSEVSPSRNTSITATNEA